MAGTVFNYTVHKGDMLRVSAVYSVDGVTPDLTGYGARFAIIWGETDNDEWVTTESDQDNPITLGEVGQIDVVVPGSETAKMPVSKKNVKYQLAIDADGGDDDRETVLYGTVEILYSAIEDADD